MFCSGSLTIPASHRRGELDGPWSIIVDPLCTTDRVDVASSLEFVTRYLFILQRDRICLILETNIPQTQIETRELIWHKFNEICEGGKLFRNY